MMYLKETQAAHQTFSLMAHAARTGVAQAVRAGISLHFAGSLSSQTEGSWWLLTCSAPAFAVL